MFLLNTKVSTSSQKFRMQRQRVCPCATFAARLPKSVRGVFLVVFVFVMFAKNQLRCVSGNVACFLNAAYINISVS